VYFSDFILHIHENLSDENHYRNPAKDFRKICKKEVINILLPFLRLI